MEDCTNIQIPMLEITRAFSAYKEFHGQMPAPESLLTMRASLKPESSTFGLDEIIKHHRFPPYDSPSVNSAIASMLERGMNTNGSFLYDISLFSRYHRAFSNYLERVPERTLQIGPGGSLGVEVLFAMCGVAEACTIDPFPLMTFDLGNFMASLGVYFQSIQYLKGLNDFTPAALVVPDFMRLADGSCRVGTGTITHFHPRSFENTGFPDGSIDFLFSHATLEHVRDPRQCIREAARVLRPGGITAHCIDLRDHRNFDRPLGFLCESEARWTSMMEEYCRHDGSGYMNRWRAHEFRDVFAAEGFEILECTSEMVASEEMMAADLPYLDSAFRNLPMEELANISVSIVARKKSAAQRRVEPKPLQEQQNAKNASLSATRDHARVTMGNRPASCSFRIDPSSIRHDEGYCFICRMTEETDRFEGFILLEDEKPIGQENNVHSQIRQYGQGLFSPWKETLFFSSSDGSDPRLNGRRYTLVMTLKRSLADIITNFSFPQYDAPSQNSAVKAMIDKGINTNGSILRDCVNFADFWRPVRTYMNGIPASTLQVGPGGSLGFEVLFALAGVKQAFTIDAFPLLTFDLGNFMETLESILSITCCFEGINGFPSRPLTLPPCRTVAAGEYRVGDSVIRHIFPRSFEDIGFPDASIDYLFSNATMEHVLDPGRCIREAARVLQPGGITVHGIDLRDHRNFDLPLEFLKESDEMWAETMKEYCGSVPHGFMNRWRVGDFRRAFEAAGLDVLECTPILKTDEDYLERNLPEFDKRFRMIPRDELSITSVFMVARKKLCAA